MSFRCTNDIAVALLLVGGAKLREGSSYSPVEPISAFSKKLF